MATELTIPLSGPSMASVPAMLLRPAKAFALLVLAHGAGAGMRHPHLERLAQRLAEQGVATLRYEFPYMAAGQRRPDRPALLHATVRAAVDAGRELATGLELLAGGRSMGGRMTSQAEAQASLDVAGLVFFAFPLHPPKKPGVARAEHLADVHKPMLFLSGTRDTLADLELLRDTTSHLGDVATLVEIDGADHSFSRLKRYGKSLEETELELAEYTAAFARSL